MYIRLAFNNNGPLLGDEMIRYIQEKVKNSDDERLQKFLSEIKKSISKGAQPRKNNKISRSQVSRKELVPANFRKDLESYVVPTLDKESLPETIKNLIDQEKHVFILGESGLGKSLLMAHCYLNFNLKGLSCFYSIDRTQGPDVYKSAAVINSLRTQIEGIAGLSKIDQLAPSGPNKDWVYERDI